MKKYYKKSDIIFSLIIFLLILSFILLPFLAVFREAFFYDGNFSLYNFKQILADKSLVLNTFKLGILTSLFASFFAINVSIFYFFQKGKARKLISIILAIALISPPFVSSLSYITLFGRSGVITYDLLHLSVNPYGMWGIVLMQAISDLSLNSLLLIGFLNSIDKSIINSARSLGAKTSHIIKDIILPSMKNGILAVMTLSFFRSVSDFGTPAIIGGNFRVLALESYFEVISKGNLSLASAMNIVILIPTLILFLFVGKGIRSGNFNTGFVSENEVPIKKKGILFNLIRIIAIILILWIVLLYASIILNAFTKKKLGNLVFTLENFSQSNKFIAPIVIRSIVYSLIAAFLATFIGFMISYLREVRELKYMKFVDTIANLPYIIPGTFFGLGYLLFFRSPPIQITGTVAIVVLNVIFKQMPFSSRVSSAAIAEIDKNVLNSIRDLGGSSKDEIKDGVIPLSKNSIMVSLINIFTATMTTVGSIIFLIYPGQKVLTLVMFDVIQSGKYNQGSVIAFYIMLICLLFNGLVRFLFNRRRNVSRS
ncbi:MAG: iron ABC transporter permease [Anaerococcus sp.]|nr:iron ABC transporter permease [Peptoniphilaceae bacterium]MDY3054533.1 iron ABC transporter permease [Anaerococcus sp.]